MNSKLTYDELLNRVIVLEREVRINKTLKDNLSNTNELLQLLLDTMPNPVFYKDINGVYQKCNDSFSKLILGIPKEQIIGKTLFDLPDVIPSDLAALYKKKDEELFTNPGNQYYEGEVLCSDNKKHTFIFNKATLMNTKNEIIGLVGVMLDVSDLRNSQKELDKKNIKLEKLSYIDPLTKVYNRRKFDDIFSKTINTNNELVLNFSIIDIDDFKLYNDSFGHYEGDVILKEVASIIKNNLLRTTDMVFRLGGEEFGLLFFTKSYIDGVSLLNKIKDEIENKNIAHKNKFGKLTISAGLISIKNSNFSEKVIYTETDSLLYESKNSGKNKIMHKFLN